MTKDEIKAAYPLPGVLRGYGIDVGRGGFCHCPFHEGDRTASLKTYPDGTWHCFGCGAHGDQIDFVMMMEGVGFREACRLICGEYPDGGTARRIALHRMEEDSAERKRRRRERAYRRVLDEIDRCRETQKSAKPFGEEWGRAVNRLPYLIGKMESMSDGSFWDD